MGKRQRTPHFITGIGDGNVYDGKSNKHNNNDVSRLRGNKDGQNKNDDKAADSNKNSNYNRHHATRNDLLHRMDEADGDPADSWRDSFRDEKTDIPVMDLKMDIGNINGGIGIGVGDIANPVDSSGPWQVSAFAFLGVIVVIAIVLHFVAETSAGASNHNKKGSIDKGTSSKSRHHSGSNSRPSQYRRRQRQRRMQKLRKKKTDEWSDDEEPIQNGAGLLSFPSFGTGNVRTGNSSFDGDYGSPDHPSPYEYDYDYDYENEYDNHNRSVYHQADYYREPNSYLSAQDISLRRTGTTRDSYDYYATTSQASGGAAGVVPTYKSPAASKYLMESTASSSKTSALVHRSTTTPQRGISPMNSYSSAGSGSRQRQQRRQRQNIGKNYSSNDSVSSPLWEMDKNGNHSSTSGNSNNQGKANNNVFTSTSPSMSSNQTPGSGRLQMPSTPENATGSSLFRQHQRSDRQNFPDDSALSLLQQPALMPRARDNLADGFDHGAVSSRPTELGARLLDSGSRFSSFASIGDIDVEGSESSSTNIGERNLRGTEEDELGTTDDREIGETWSRASGGGYGEIERFDASPPQSHSSHHSIGSNVNIESPSLSMYNGSFSSSVHSHHQQDMHQKSLLLTPGNCEETPIIGNARRTIGFSDGTDSSLDAAALLPISGTSAAKNIGQVSPMIPYVPHLKTEDDVDSALSPVLFSTDPPPPPNAIIMDELRLVEMETGNSTHWNIENSESSNNGDHASFAGDEEGDQQDTPAAELESSDNGSASYNGSDISIPSGDPRKSIIHKRRNLTMSTDAATSLQSSIDFDELQLQEVIGGGGFGQVWKATWRGTPVAVKVLTGSAQNTHIAKAILEEFKAEINLLKGMRHPNICLYMGACVTPPNRAIITELAANGSAWDSLRLPLVPPYSAADGTPRGCWPLSLYLPGQHGIPPRSNGSSLSSEISAPIPPRGTWPWELVKRVSCGAARGMAYLHSGNPPVLHRDLKSANLLLDESYTTKVCDFGLSRLKAQARSMTANCGTVQWMAPEVLANRSYDEKADVYSFGIIVWELLSRECPYEGMTAIQCALAVLNRDKRPEIPKWCPPGLHALIKSCIKKDPADRPTFVEVIAALDALG